MLRLIVEPDDGVGPLLAAIKSARKSVEIAIFRFDHKEIEAALKAAATAKRVGVSAVIAFANRGGEETLRKLEMRFLDAGIVVARSADDLSRYHGKYILIDRRVLYLLSFNFTRLDIGHSRGFGIVTTNPAWVREATKLFEADCTRTTYTSTPSNGTFVVSPTNSRKTLSKFLNDAKAQLLIYDPKISDVEMLRILHGRAKAGVEIKIIGAVAGSTDLNVQALGGGTRLHTRTIIRDRRLAFVGSQSLRKPELDSRREVGLIMRDAQAVKKLIATFESDWMVKRDKAAAVPEDPPHDSADAEKAVEILTKELDPLADTVKKAVRKAVAKAGDEVLHDRNVKHTMKKVVKQAVKDAVKEAVQDSNHAEPTS
jgi:phosphatidylserine/phosphatidylglycerophosphate/cardiolipin synthase-like enzyme